MRDRVGRAGGPAGAARSGPAPSTPPACASCAARPSDAGYARDFSIYDGDDQLRLIRRCLVRARRSTRSGVAPRARPGAGSPTPRTEMQAPDEVAARPRLVQRRVVAPRLPPLPGRRCAPNGAMDFDDLLMVTVAAARERRGRAAPAGSAASDHVLVDEYQDTNHAQYRLVRVPRREPQRNVWSSATTTRASTRWRGADVRNILDFERDYPDAHVVALEQNYRSTGASCARRTRVIARNPHRTPKRLWTDLGDGEPIVAVTCRRRARGGARGRRRDRRGPRAATGALGDFAVFYRTNAQSPRDRGRAASAPGAVPGRGRRRASTSAPRSGPARLPARGRQPGRRVSLRADARRAQARHRPGAIAKLEAHARGARRRRGRRLLRPDESPACPPASAPSAGPDRRPARDVRDPWPPAPPLDRLLEEVLERSGLRDALQARGHVRGAGADREPGGDGAAWRPSSRRTQQEATLADFLEGIALQADADLVDRAAGAVTLMTIHNAKGLEFDTASSPGSRRALFPHCARTPRRRWRRSGASSTWA